MEERSELGQPQIVKEEEEPRFEIKDGFAEGKDLVVTVMSAMGEEQICALKDIGPKVRNLSGRNLTSGHIGLTFLAKGSLDNITEVWNKGMTTTCRGTVVVPSSDKPNDCSKPIFRHVDFQIAAEGP
ncbi:hypothetical protein RJ639_040177 [Escallonia herrerae]|uniref:Translation initiation factor 5A C-terminal domain-containing protein n=1 Tax=Escallonia herrerae TaxID=1293975 RepID=A0AA88WJH7_9ASTE|nr:hypothetical protein RJ639_040177 [Escallonia herrerae]